MSAFTRLILCDASLRDNVGHQVEYDRALADAARASSLDVAVLAHRQAQRHLQGFAGLVGVFSEDMWGGRRQWPGFAIAWRSLLLRLLQFVLVLPAAVQLADAVMVRLHARRPAGRGWRRDASGGALAPLLRHVRDNLPVPHWLLFLMSRNPRLLFELRLALKSIRLGSSDLLFCHMLIHRNILEWACIVASLPRGNTAQAVLLLRYQPSFYAPHTPLSRLAFRALEQAFEEGKLRTATDSERLAREFAVHTYLPLEIFPIPHTQFRATTRHPAAEIRVASLGNARAEKGIVEILRAVGQFNEKWSGRPVRFVLQLNDPDKACASEVAHFLASAPPNAEIYTASLTTPQYKALVDSVDIVLAPYRAEVYASRTSGVFLEAVAAGKAVIVTRGTWMSDQLAGHGAGLTVPSCDPGALCEAIRAICGRLDDFREKARSAARIYRQRHSPEALLQKLLTPTAALQPQKLAVLVYPWRTFLTTHAGAALRTSLLVDFLRHHGWVVAALVSSENEVLQHPDVRLLAYPDEPIEVRRNGFLLLYVAVMRLGSLFRSRPVEWLFFCHRHWYRARCFKLTLNRALIGAGAVFVEYTFFAELVRPFAKARGLPMVVTAHDVLADQATHPDWARKLLAVETEALKKADFAVSVSPRDRAAFERAGVQTGMVPNSIASPPRNLRHDDVARLLHDLKIDADRPFVLFVGSFNRPNNEAKEALKEISRRLRAAARIDVVVAGSCASPSESRDNFIALGIVGENAKAALYERCLACVIPLARGSGTSLKTIEAMSHARPVIGTSLAFRGYPVRDGVDALICDDLSRYDRIIESLRQDRPRARELGERARVLAGAYDYRVTYQPYLQFIERFQPQALTVMPASAAT